MKPKIHKLVDLIQALRYLASQDASLDTEVFLEFFTDGNYTAQAWPLETASDLELSYIESGYYECWEHSWGDLQTVYNLLKEEYGEDCYMRVP